METIHHTNTNRHYANVPPIPTPSSSQESRKPPTTTTTAADLQRIMLDDLCSPRAGICHDLTSKPKPITIPLSNPIFYPTPQNSPPRSSAIEPTLSTNINDTLFALPQDATTDSIISDFIKKTETREEPILKNTYFLDGSGCFISVPSLGNSSTRGASPISRIVEEWLESKICFHATPDAVPTPENVENSAQDIMRKVRARANRVLNGLSSVFINLRAGPVSAYNNNNNNDADADADSTTASHDLCLDSMAEFFQQFHLFVEVSIRVLPSEASNSNSEVFLAIENVALNPSKPCVFRETFCHAEEPIPPRLSR